jgi:hypothetical protein
LELQADHLPSPTDPSQIPDQLLAEFCQGCASQLNEHSWKQVKAQVSSWAAAGPGDKNTG